MLPDIIIADTCVACIKFVVGSFYRSYPRLQLKDEACDGSVMWRGPAGSSGRTSVLRNFTSK
jgi:hypothetical protein